MSENLTDIVEELRDLSESREQVTVGDVTDSFGARGFGPLITLPALLGASPLGGIPGVPTFMALIILIFAVQITLGRSSLWLPQIIKTRGVDHSRVTNSADKLEPVAHWIDDHFGNRLTCLTGETPRRVAAGVIAVICIAIPPLELLPFAALLPFVAIACLALAITLHDGVLIMIAAAVTAAAAWFGLSMTV